MVWLNFVNGIFNLFQPPILDNLPAASNVCSVNMAESENPTLS